MRFFMYVFVLFFTEIKATPIPVSIETHVRGLLQNQNIDVLLDTVTTKFKEPLVFKDVQFLDQHRRFSLDVWDADGKKYPCVGRIRWFVDVPVLNHPVSKDDVIREEDLGWSRIPMESVSATLISKIDEIIGKTPRSGMLRPSIPVHRHELHYPPMIRKGDSVEILYKSPTLEIMNRDARSLEQGSLNDWVTIEVMSTQFDGQKVKKQIRARVVSPGQAVVSLS